MEQDYTVEELEEVMRQHGYVKIRTTRGITSKCDVYFNASRPLQYIELWHPPKGPLLMSKRNRPIHPTMIGSIL